jgi:hypothetical protein
MLITRTQAYNYIVQVFQFITSVCSIYIKQSAVIYSYLQVFEKMKVIQAH